MEKINIALDGHSSCGKSTIAKRLAKELGYTYIDTGAMYRGVTLYTMREGLWQGEEPDVVAIEAHLPRIELRFRQLPQGGEVLLLNGEEVEQEIRGMAVSSKVSPISTIPAVRHFLVEQQQAMARDKGVVMDGRDIGTVVLPDAELKIFITARAEVRAQRRYDELRAKGDRVTFEEILENVTTRDRIDSSRATSPLKRAEDAVLLDNSDMTMEEQQAIVTQWVRQALSGDPVEIEIDSSSGFCFGVVKAIEQAEKELGAGSISSLGSIVHNEEEVKRLEGLGMSTIQHSELTSLTAPPKRLLFRAHGEAPKVYEMAKQMGVEVVDATCPVVLALQKQIRKAYDKTREEQAQIVIFGKKNHPEVIGLIGQVDNDAVVVTEIEEVKEVVRRDRPIMLFSQTTMPRDGYQLLRDYLCSYVDEGVAVKVHDSICKQVSNRVPEIREFVQRKDWIIFVAGRSSSNGRVLYQTVREANPNATFVSSADEITAPLPPWIKQVGICGATSTPQWQMEQVRDRLLALNKKEDL